MYYDANDAQFLMGIVDNPHSDYDDALDGYPNYSIDVDPNTGVPVLTVSFVGADESTLVGKWRLSLVSLVATDPQSDEESS